MLEKPLTEADWKKFSKDRGYKDAALLKALGALAKADEMAPDDQLKALEAVEKEVAALLKSVRGDKELTAHVPVVQAALKKQRKAAELAAEAAAKVAEEPASALLDPKKLLDQLNQCKRKPDRSVQFGYVDGKEKAPAVLAMHPTMSGRTLMAKLQESTGGKTGAYGTAWIEGSSLMLQLDKPLSGLVKKVRAPLKAAGFRIANVVLWNADGSVFEKDSEDADGNAEPTAVGEGGNGLQQAFAARMAELKPQVLKALKEQRGDGTKLRTVMGFADQKAADGSYDSALKALDALEALLAAAGAATGSAAAGGEVFSKVQFEKIHLEWESRKKAVGLRLAELNAAIMAEFDDPESVSAAKNLSKVLARFNEGLGDTLVALRNAPDKAVRAQFAAKASQVADRYLSYLDSHPLVAHVEANPYEIKVAVRETLSAPLSAVKLQLAKLVGE